MGMSTSPALYKKFNVGPLKDFEVKVLDGMYTPKGTPAPVLGQINTAMRDALAEPSIMQRLGELSSEIPFPDKIEAAHRFTQACKRVPGVNPLHERSC